MLKSKLVSSASIAVVSLSMAMPAQAQNLIDEIIVTARKKAESLQNVPVAVSALDSSAIAEFGIENFEDYLTQMPSLTAGGVGPHHQR